MSHLEKDMHTKQLMAHLQELSALRAINTDTIYTTPVAGAFVDCGTISFFIAAGLGKQVIEDIPVIFLSAQSPWPKSWPVNRQEICWRLMVR